MIDQTADDAWLAPLPKVENHVHLEGCVPRSVVLAAAARAGTSPPVAEYSELDGFLLLLDAQCVLLTDEADLRAVAHDRVDTAFANGIRHTDLIVNPAHWPSWRNRLDEMLSALDLGFQAAEDDMARTAQTDLDFVPTTNLSLSIGRGQSAEEAEALVDVVVSGRFPRVAGISVDGNESAPNAGSQRFAAALQRVRDSGRHVAVHTGESGGPDKIRATLDDLRPDRIDHGIRAAEDPSLIRRLATEQIPLAVCLTSNTRLGVVADVRNHPIVALLAAGVACTLNTDDPGLLGTSLNAEFQLASATFGWTRADFVGLVRTSILTANVDAARRAALTADLDRFVLATSGRLTSPTGELC